MIASDRAGLDFEPLLLFGHSLATAGGTVY
jgi:hypothetical protein